MLNKVVVVVVSIPACHAGDPGSIPGNGDLVFVSVVSNWLLQFYQYVHHTRWLLQFHQSTCAAPLQVNLLLHLLPVEK